MARLIGAVPVDGGANLLPVEPFDPFPLEGTWERAGLVYAAQSQIIAVQATASTPARATMLANAFARQTVQFRTNAMHAQLATLIPSLQASIRKVSPGDRAGLWRKRRYGASPRKRS